MIKQMLEPDRAKRIKLSDVVDCLNFKINLTMNKEIK